MKVLYLVRHGTVHNPNGVLYRRLPGFLLSHQGRREAEEAAAFLANEPLEVVYHSPLERARETAQIVNAPHHVPMVEDALIHEWGEGERSDAVLQRMMAFVDGWRESSYTVAAAVSHRDPIRRLLFGIMAPRAPADMDDLTQFPLPQGGVYRITDTDGVLAAELVFVPTEDAASPRIEVDKT